MLLNVARVLGVGVKMVVSILFMAVAVLMHPFSPEAIYNLDPKADQHYSHEEFQEQGQAIGYG